MVDGGVSFVTGAEKMVLFIYGIVGSFDMRRQSKTNFVGFLGRL